MDFPIIIIRVSPLSFVGVSGVILNFIQFFDKSSLSKQNSPRWDAAFCGVSSGSIVCLCPIKGTPGLNELKIMINGGLFSQFCIDVSHFSIKRI